MKIYTTNPATGEKIKGYGLFNLAKLDNAVRNSDKALEKWNKYPVGHRALLMKEICNKLLKNKFEYANIITKEMGKPIKESIAEIEKCAWLCSYYSDNAEKFLHDEIIRTGHKYSGVRFEPLGKILCIMPWNFPFWQVLRCAVPALCAGNTIILKHSSVVLGSSLEIQKLFDSVLDKGVFQTVITDRKGVNYLMNKVDGISLTGSVETGKIVGEAAGKRLKKFVLELGGSDAFIVLDDADIKFTCEHAVKARILTSGQSCISAKRFIVVKEKFDEFKEQLIERVKRLKVGNPLSDDTDIGPLAREEFLVKLDKQVKDSIRQGAKLLYGGKRIEGKGYYYMPTVLVAKNNMKTVKEETFGPVFALIKVKDEKKAIKEANNSEFGLGASIWTRDIRKGLEYAKEIEAGVVFVNNIVRSDPRLPFGGVKNSGVGRELNRYGLLEFCNIKSVVGD